MRIRDAAPEDRDAIVALQVASWRDAYAAALPAGDLGDRLAAHLAGTWAARNFRPPLLTLVAEADGLLGFVCCLADRAPPYIDNLHVRPGLRSGGTGGRLMAACFDRLRAQGYRGCALTVLDGNARARAFYARLGGVEAEPRPTSLLGRPVVEVPVLFRL